jgi:hypothetical protein
MAVLYRKVPTCQIGLNEFLFILPFAVFGSSIRCIQLLRQPTRESLRRRTACSGGVGKNLRIWLAFGKRAADWSITRQR